jgi:hypothetical protein
VVGQRVPIVLNDPPYGTERFYERLRLAIALSKRDDVEVRVFLIADAVGYAVAGQKVPEGSATSAVAARSRGRRRGSPGSRSPGPAPRGVRIVPAGLEVAEGGGASGGRTHE